VKRPKKNWDIKNINSIHHSNLYSENK